MMIKNYVTLNISEKTMNKNQLDSLMLVYENCEGWMGYSTDSIPYWFSRDESEKHICVSAEPHGLML
jgi:hypothetical protein